MYPALIRSYARRVVAEMSIVVLSVVERERDPEPRPRGVPVHTPRLRSSRLNRDDRPRIRADGPHVIRLSLHHAHDGLGPHTVVLHRLGGLGAL